MSVLGLLPLFLLPFAAAAKPEKCRNYASKCQEWALRGDCIRDRTYMDEFCRDSCDPECLVERRLLGVSASGEPQTQAAQFGAAESESPPSVRLATGQRRAQETATGPPSAALQLNAGAASRIIVNPLSIFRQGAQGAQAHPQASEWGRTEVGGGGCVDKHRACPKWAEKSECLKDTEFMLQICALSCDPKCRSGFSTSPRAAQPPPQRALPTFTQQAATALPSPSTRQATAQNCVNKHSVCGNWAAKGECELYPELMKQVCPASCISNCQRVAAVAAVAPVVPVAPPPQPTTTFLQPPQPATTFLQPPPTTTAFQPQQQQRYIYPQQTQPAQQFQQYPQYVQQYHQQFQQNYQQPYQQPFQQPYQQAPRQRPTQYAQPPAIPPQAYYPQQQSFYGQQPQRAQQQYRYPQASQYPPQYGQGGQYPSPYQPSFSASQSQPPPFTFESQNSPGFLPSEEHYPYRRSERDSFGSSTRPRASALYPEDSGARYSPRSSSYPPEGDRFPPRYPDDDLPYAPRDGPNDFSASAARDRDYRDYDDDRDDGFQERITSVDSEAFYAENRIGLKVSDVEKKLK